MLKENMNNKVVHVYEIQRSSSPGLGIRHLIAFMLFLALASSYTMRINLSVGIVAMVNSSAVHIEVNASQSCPYPDNFNSSLNNNLDGPYLWNENTQGLILGSFYYGYALTNFVGGRASERFGGRVVLGVGIGLTGILAIITPLVASISSWLMVTVRIMQGMAQGCLFPTTNHLLAQWFPIEERSKLAGFVYAGANIGTVIALTTSGFMCGSDFMGGWPSVFYVYGSLGVIFSLLWVLLVKNSPQEHSWLSEKEKTYILGQGTRNKAEKIPVPWKSIFFSKYFYVIVIANFGNNWGYYTLLSELPTYFDKILHIDIQNNGTLSSMPYLTTALFSLFYSIFIGKLLKKKTVSILFVRRLSMALAGYMPMVCLFVMCFVGCHSNLALAILILSGGFTGCGNCGFMCSHADLSPRFAGTLMGLTNTIGTIPGFASPALTGYLTNDNQTLSAWRTIFFIASLCYAICTTIYIFGITSDVQPWNEGQESSVKDKTEKLPASACANDKIVN